MGQASVGTASLMGPWSRYVLLPESTHYIRRELKAAGHNRCSTHISILQHHNVLSNVYKVMEYPGKKEGCASPST